ncbi:MAG: hypothetical protein ACREQQ_12435, partial [Candidatus Binatia bacterium]
MASPVSRAWGRWSSAFLLALLALGLARAVALAWVCDDSFISFRYAESLLEGRGLVYNAGERVEGYTNLSWTLLIALAMRLGFEPVAASEALGIACYLGLVGALVGFALRRSRLTDLPFVPLSAALVLVLDDFHAWATGGLETMLFTWLATYGILSTRRSVPTARRAAATGAVLALAILTRPDGLIFAVAAVASYWLTAGADVRRRALGASLITVLPIAIVVAGLVAFKLAYYGEIFPTAFFSKSVVRPYPSQGLVYLGLYLAKNWFLAPALVAALILSRRAAAPASVSGLARLSTPVFLVGTAALFIGYVVHSGGDFMFARRLIP